MSTVGVHALIFNENHELLLVKKNYGDREWAVPGGVLEDHESIEQGIIREVLEETGYEIKVGEVVAVASRPRTNDVIIVTTGKILLKTMRQPNHQEIAACGFFSVKSLPSPIKPEVFKLLEIFNSGTTAALVEI